MYVALWNIYITLKQTELGHHNFLSFLYDIKTDQRFLHKWFHCYFRYLLDSYVIEGLDVFKFNRMEQDVETAIGCLLNSKSSGCIQFATVCS